MSPTAAILAELRRIRTAVEKASAPRPTLLTYAEAARELSLGTGLTKLRQMVRRGELKTVMLGKRPRVPRSEVERLSAVRELPRPTERRRPSSPRAEADKIRAALRGAR